MKMPIASVTNIAHLFGWRFVEVGIRPLGANGGEFSHLSV
jgi:hypothetical protein